MLILPSKSNLLKWTLAPRKEKTENGLKYEAQWTKESELRRKIAQLVKITECREDYGGESGNNTISQEWEHLL